MYVLTTMPDSELCMYNRSVLSDLVVGTLLGDSDDMYWSYSGEFWSDG